MWKPLEVPRLFLALDAVPDAPEKSRIHVTSISLKRTGPKTGEMTGDLTLHGQWKLQPLAMGPLGPVARYRQ